MSAPPPTPRILETALYAEDLDAAKDFYGRILDLQIVTEVTGRHVFFRLAGSMLLIFNPSAVALGPRPGTLPVPPHGASGPGHVCFAAGAEGIEMWRLRFGAEDIVIEADFHWPNGARSLYVRDPAENSVEVSTPALWGF